MISVNLLVLSKCLLQLSFSRPNKLFYSLKQPQRSLSYINSTQQIYAWPVLFCLAHLLSSHCKKCSTLQSIQKCSHYFSAVAGGAVWYLILLFPILPISFALDTWHLHNGLAPSPVYWDTGEVTMCERVCSCLFGCEGYICLSRPDLCL